MKAKLVWVTPEAENVIAYCARVSNPANQDNPNISKLLKYCLDNSHYSIFEMAEMCVEIETSRAIAAQILRHSSLKKQEFSLRYSKAIGFEDIQLRRKDTKNRQNSIDDLSDEVKLEFEKRWDELLNDITKLYDWALKNDVANECARMVLPLTTTTRLYLKGNLRDWIFYLKVRTKEDVQLEHRELAKLIQDIFVEQFPIISDALGWA